jgi:hypothetical protein
MRAVVTAIFHQCDRRVVRLAHPLQQVPPNLFMNVTQCIPHSPDGPRGISVLVIQAKPGGLVPSGVAALFLEDPVYKGHRD